MTDTYFLNYDEEGEEGWEQVSRESFVSAGRPAGTPRLATVGFRVEAVRGMILLSPVQWAEMSDLDKGAALLHLHKREYEGAAYAEDNYPARYFDHPRLTSLNFAQACAHAVSVHGDACALTLAENDRLYDLALAADRRKFL